LRSAPSRCTRISRAEHGLLRFGLPAGEDDWQRLHAALQSLPQQAAAPQPGAMHADA